MKLSSLENIYRHGTRKRFLLETEAEKSGHDIKIQGSCLKKGLICQINRQLRKYL